MDSSVGLLGCLFACCRKIFCFVRPLSPRQNSTRRQEKKNQGCTPSPPRHNCTTSKLGGRLALFLRTFLCFLSTFSFGPGQSLSSGKFAFFPAELCFAATSQKLSFFGA